MNYLASLFSALLATHPASQLGKNWIHRWAHLHFKARENILVMPFKKSNMKCMCVCVCVVGFPRLLHPQQRIHIQVLTLTNTCQQSGHQKQHYKLRGIPHLLGSTQAREILPTKVKVSVHRGACCSYQSCKEGHSQMPEVIVQQSAVHHVPEDSNASWLTQRVSCRDTQKHEQASPKRTRSSRGAPPKNTNKAIQSQEIIAQEEAS